MKFLKAHRQNLGIIALIILLVMFEVVLYLNYRIELDSYSGYLAAITAFLGVILSSSSITIWGNKQKAEIKDLNSKVKERLEEKKLELAAEITEAFYAVNQSIKKICNPLSLNQEEEQAEKDFHSIEDNLNYPTKNSRIIKRGLVFLERWNKELPTINHLFSLKIKARIYFGENLEKCFDEASSFLQIEIWLRISMLLEGTSKFDAISKSASKQLWDYYRNETPMDKIIQQVELILIPMIREKE